MSWRTNSVEGPKTKSIKDLTKIKIHGTGQERGGNPNSIASRIENAKEICMRIQDRKTQRRYA
jgi:hypothetical protein